jgi:hypothetical protein
VSQTGNDAQDHRYCVARFAFRSFRLATFPIASITLLRVLRQEMAAIRTSHFVIRPRFGMNNWRVRVFHVHFNK